MHLFGASSTIDEVLAESDVHGLRILVTGVSAGLGVEIARGFAARGARVIGAARNLAKARAAASQFASAVPDTALQLIRLDLASLDSVRECADDLVHNGEPFDLVIANAGVMGGSKSTTADGFESQFGTNHLGHFVFINRIAGLLKSGGRVVMVSSAGHRRANVDIEDPNFEHTSYDELIAYGRSKTANILFAVEFDRRHRSGGIRAFAVHPGAIMTETVRKLIKALGAGQGAAVASFTWKTVPQGAATSVWAGTIAPPDEIGGRYCEDCHVAEIDDDPSSRRGVRSYALDSTNATALWTASERMVAESFSFDRSLASQSSA